MNFTRKIVYGSLALLVGAMLLFVAALHPDARGGFWNEYGRNLRRLTSGEWNWDEVRDTRIDRSRDRVSGRQGRGYGRAVFQKLDRDGSGVLTAEEVGERLSQQLFQNRPGNDAPMALSLQEFENALGGGRRRPVRAVVAEPVGKSAMPHPGESIEHLTEDNATTPQQVQLDADILLDPNHVVVVDVELAEQDWAMLCNQSRSFRSAVENPLDKPYSLFRANITVDGVVIEDVGIRKKGFIGSQDRQRPSLKIKFDTYRDHYRDQAPIRGLDRLTLNNNKQDRGLISQALTYQLFRKAGIAAPRSTFAAVTVNGKYLGIYTHVESVKKPFLRRNFGEDTGALYEGTLTDLYPPSIEWFEGKTKEADETVGRAFLKELSDLAADELSTAEDIAELVDVDHFLKFWAVETVINFWDGYTQNQNNFFIYRNPANGLAYFAPWGADSCFGRRPQFTRRPGMNSESVRATGILANKLYRCEGIPQRYRQSLETVLAEVWQEAELLAEINRIEQLLRDHLDLQQISAIVAVDDVRQFIRRRRKVLTQELGDEWPIAMDYGPRIPQHHVVVGACEATLRRFADDSRSVDGVVTLNETECALNKVEMDEDVLTLAADHDDSFVEIRLQLSRVAQERLSRPVKLETVQGETANPDKQSAVQVTGRVSGSRGRWKARGQLQRNVRADGTVDVDVQLEALETRGGFRDRR